MGTRISSLLVDNAARAALNAILGRSIEERKEYGGMLYVRDANCFATPPRTQKDPTRVDVGQREQNCGCPAGTTPIAYYHTHPTYSVGGLKAQYNELSDEDKDVARDFKLDAAYVGTLDGSFLKFDCGRNITVVLSGRLKNTR
jgi:Domain of unknown function (DUF4329)